MLYPLAHTLGIQRCRRLAWEAPIAYTGVATGYLVQSALYCEYSVLHEARASKRVSPSVARRLAREALQAIRGARSGWATLTIAGEVLGVPVIVSPDALLVKDGRPVAVVRARVRRSLNHYPGDWAPLYLAAAALDGLFEGKLDSSLTLALILAEDHARLAEALAKVRSLGPKPSRGDGWTVVTRVYTFEDARRLLSRPLDIIVGRSRPRPPPPSRCAKCRWRESCPWSRA